MKKFTSLVIGFSLALAGAATAQQPEEQSTPKNKKPEKTHAETKAEPNAPKPEATAGKQHGGKHATLNTQNAEQTPKGEGRGKKGTNVSGERGATATPSGNQEAEQGKKGQKGRGENALNARTSTTPAPSASADATSVTTDNARNRQGNGQGKLKQKPAPEQVQQIKQQHTNFHAQARPDKAPAVTFNQNYRIQGSDRWQGAQYEVFRSYHPERHDQGWYRSHYGRVELIGGGYYYWNNGYWYPAWGYDPSAEYYAYDGPVYVGHSAEPPDQVIADVQSELQQMGYYQGESTGCWGH